MAPKPEAEEQRSLKSEIDQDIKEALKARNNLKLGVLRMLKSEIKYKEIDKGSELSDDEVISILSSSVKKRKETIEQFEKGRRDDLVSREKAELEVVRGVYAGTVNPGPAFPDNPSGHPGDQCHRTFRSGEGDEIYHAPG